ncbi:MAG: DUF3996 domain-containing protein [Balneolaceae bacterium]
MKNLLLLILLVIIPITFAQAQNTDKNFGLGVIIGEPTGLSLAYWTSNSRSFSAGAAWSLHDNSRGNESVQVHVDYLFHNFNIVSVERGSMPLYIGFGARLRLGDNEKAGIRIPLGAAYHFQNDPFEIFLEFVPIFDLTPSTGISGNSGLGIRYYF